MAARRKAKPRPLPTFDPVPSAQFGLEILDRSKSRRALIGRVAMWYWLDDEADHEYTKDVDQLIQIGRRVLRQKFFEADIGVSGVNFAVAETGTLLLVENEGNGRMSTTLPRILMR